MSAEFILTSLIVVLLPGTGVIYTVTTGLIQEGKASLFAAAGCTAGIVSHLLASDQLRHCDKTHLTKFDCLIWRTL